MASNPYQTIAGELREQIAEGQLRPGDQVPAVTELAAAHGVSVGTAHRALALLTSEGLVSVARHRRATVAGAE
nr:winged helix-turn-helix domain-containing protein [Micromonospora sp. MW-13]